MFAPFPYVSTTPAPRVRTEQGDIGGTFLAVAVRVSYRAVARARRAEDAPVVGERLAGAVQPAGTLLGVSRLAFPDLLIEIEATAVA